jgi:CheY-like chemotaxis protein
MLTFLQRAIGPTIVIDSHFPPDLPLALCDQNQLENALLNLAVNARDAMPSGGRVTISARREIVGPEDTRLAPGAYVVLSVSDDGAGMDEATLARAMDPFFTTKGVGKGTGLGLSMVHGLAAQSDGRLTLTSAPGKGTVAEVWLVASEGESAIETTERAKGRVVLVVDDDPLVLTNTAALLEDLGHHVVCATSGAEALEAIRHHAELSVLITDYAMPGMTGVQLREEALRMRPGLPTLLLTGFDGVPPQVDWPSERLRKPFAQEELAEAVNRVLGAAGEEASPAPAPAGGA